MNPNYGKQIRVKKDISTLLKENDLHDETKLRLVEESNINALLIGETDIDAEIVVEGIKDSLDSKYSIVAVEKYKFLILEK
jgi:hypothetical protein